MANERGYRGYTEAGARAHRKYMERFVEVKVRMEPERREAIKKHASEHGESVTGFFLRAASETMERDDQANPAREKEAKN